MMAEHERTALRVGTTSHNTAGMALIELSEKLSEIFGICMFSLFKVY